MSGSPAPGHRSKRLHVLLAVLALAALAMAWKYDWLRPARAVPEIPLAGHERKVIEKVNEARAAAQRQPHSADAWAHLGRVLLANELAPDAALTCFLEAERLDANEPRWPYFSAGLLIVDRPDKAVPKLERTLALAEPRPNPPSAPRLLLAETMVSLGQADNGAEQFRKVLATDPTNPRAHFGLGLQAYARADWPSCRTHLEACLSSPEARKKACVHLATVCERLGDTEAAGRYAKLAAVAPNDVDWRDPYVAEHLHLIVSNRGRYRVIESLEAQGQFSQALNILSGLLLDYPTDYRPHLMMGRILGQTGDLATAEQHLRKAFTMAPEKLQIHYLLSLVLFRKGEALSAKDGTQALAVFREAAETARQVLALRPDYGYAHMALGLALKQLGQHADALIAFREAVHCNPDYADNHLFLGEALAEAGEATQARYHLEQAALLALPNDPRPQAALDKLLSPK